MMTNFFSKIAYKSQGGRGSNKWSNYDASCDVSYISSTASTEAVPLASLETKKIVDP